MNRSRVSTSCVLALAGLSLSCGGNPYVRRLQESDGAIGRGVAWLLSKQSPDGGWRSETYGNLKAGAATTALVLYAASRLPEQHWKPHEAAWRRGWAFLRKGLTAKGCVAAPDGTVDYPTYATAMALTAVRRFGWEVPAADLARMRQYLLDSQLTEKQGWKPEDPCYGGWDHIGHTPGAKRLTTGADISVTRFAVEGLKACGAAEGDPALERAERFVERCAAPDGGFFFAPEKESPANKAGWDGTGKTRPRPYGSPTVDGILIVRSCAGPSFRTLQIHWERLVLSGGVERVPGFREAEEGWAEGLRYYYWAGLGQVLERPPMMVDAGETGGAARMKRERLQEVILKEQRPDGSWASESARMREDDPLIATSFALIALGACRD